MSAIISKELKQYFSTMYGYVFVGMLLLITGILTTVTNLINGYSGFEYSLYTVSYIFLLIVPILTMSSLSDEGKNRTNQLLYSLPLSAKDIILGKFFAMAGILAIPTLIMCVYPLVLSVFGNVNFLTAYCAIFGFYLMGCALLAFGLFVSGMTESPVIAAVISFFSLLLMFLLTDLSQAIPKDSFTSLCCFALLAALIAFLLYYITKNETVSISLFVILLAADIAVYAFKRELLDSAFPKMLDALCVYDRFEPFAAGIFDVTAIVYYLSFTCVFLFLAAGHFEKRRWN